MLRILPMTLLLSTLIASGQPQPPAPPPPPLPLMPLPAQVKPGVGEFPINNGFGIALEGYQEPRLERAKQRFLNILSRQTGIPLWREAVLNKPLFFIKTTGPSAPVQQVDEDESYHLQITANAVHLEAANPLGVLHGLQTFLQLVRITPRGFMVPAMTIDDQPRFPWRRLMLDVGRHFMPLDVVYRTLDGMEAVKLQRLPLAPLRRSGLPGGEQEVSLVAGEGLRWPLLYPGRDSQRHRVRARSGHPRSCRNSICLLTRLHGLWVIRS